LFRFPVEWLDNVQTPLMFLCGLAVFSGGAIRCGARNQREAREYQFGAEIARGMSLFERKHAGRPARLSKIVSSIFRWPAGILPKPCVSNIAVEGTT
jgi:hypothetical protein